MTNFLSHMKELQKARKRDNNKVSIIIGHGEKAWMILYCEKSKRTYAMNMSSGKAIASGVSTIHPAFLINPKTGRPENSAVFAAKVFSGDKSQNIIFAENELEALKDHQFSEKTFSPDGQPIIISDFYPGETLSDSNGNPNTNLLANLNIEDRLALIIQIAAQYHEMHHEKLNKSAWIHRDVKGSNIIIHTRKGAPNAWIIDFGSTKKLPTSTGKEEAKDIYLKTGIEGFTTNIMPPEAISSNTKHYVELGDETGVVSVKSDVYSLTPVIATLLGAKNPYANRNAQIQTGHGLIDIGLLSNLMSNPFNLDGIMSEANCAIPGSINKRSKIAFTNCLNEEAPNSKAILEDKSIPNSGYVLYKDQLLYYDKSQEKVYNRRNTKPVTFIREIQPIKHIQTTKNLKDSDLVIINKIFPSPNQGQESLEPFIKPLIIQFLNQMQDNDPKQRPSSEEVLKFFIIVNQLVRIATQKNSSQNLVEQNQLILVELLKLNILVNHGWNIPLKLAGLEGEKLTKSSITFSEFDFDSLLEDTDTCNKLGKVFYNRTTDTLTAADFQFIAIPSEKKKTTNAIIKKLPAENEETRKKIHDFVLNVEEDLSAKLYHLPKEILLYVLTGNAQDLKLDLNTIDAFIHHENFIKSHFPKRHAEIEKFVTHTRSYYLGTLALDKLDVDQLFDLLDNVRNAKDTFTPDLYLNIIAAITKRLTSDINGYLESLNDFKDNQYRNFWSLGIFGFNVGVKRQAAHQLIESIKSGEYSQLNSKKILIPLQQRTLGKFSKPLLNAIFRRLNKTEVICLR